MGQAEILDARQNLEETSDEDALSHVDEQAAAEHLCKHLQRCGGGRVGERQRRLRRHHALLDPQLDCEPEQDLVADPLARWDVDGPRILTMLADRAEQGMMLGGLQRAEMVDSILEKTQAFVEPHIKTAEIYWIYRGQTASSSATPGACRPPH